MQITKIDLKKTKIIFLTTLVILFIVTAVTEPLLIKSTNENWGNKSDDISFTHAQKIQDAFDLKSSHLISITKKLKNRFIQLDKEENLNQKSLFEIVMDKQFSPYSIQINNNRHDLLAWNNEPPADSNKLALFAKNDEQILIVTNKLIDYLAVTSLYYNAKHSYLIFVALPIKELSLPTRTKIEKVLLLDSLQRELKTDIELEYGFDSKLKRDGRYYSFPILNNFKNKIAVASFLKPSLNQYIENQKRNIQSIQSILLLLFVWLISFELILYSLKLKSNFVKFASLTLIILGNRVLLFLLEIPTAWITGNLTDSTNFSSRFAGGMVRSPLEFFISVVAFLVVALIGYQQILNVYKSKTVSKSNQRILDTSLILTSIFLYLLLWRGFGAVLRSVIYDSTIRYFKEFSIIPSEAVFLMCLNILLLGFTIFLCSLALLVFTSKKINGIFKLSSGKLFIYFYAVVQIFGFIFDRIQSEPQGTDLIRIVFFTFSFIILYFLINRNKEIVYKYFLYAIASSIISVSLLTYYNSQLERESLKNTAYDIVRVNEEQVQFMLYQTLLEAKSNSEIVNDLKKGVECSKTAFSVWMKSMIYREGIIATVFILDSKKYILGSFSARNKERLELDENMIDSTKDIQINTRQSIFSDAKIIDGFVKIKDGNNNLGYIAVSAQVNSSKLNHEYLIKTLMPERVGILSAVDYENLKVFDYLNKELVRSSKGEKLNEFAAKNIFSAKYNESGEAWLELEINGEKNLLFLLKIMSNNGERILAIARENKNFTWNLSDFFKIFFIHVVVIALLSFMFFVSKFKRRKLAYVTFRTKLITAFLLLSIIPLFLIAAYIRNITEDRNNLTLSKVLSENISQIRNYLEIYLSEGGVDQKIIFEKASNELNKNYSVYTRKGNIYSSNPTLYKSGLFSGKINQEAYYNLIISKNSFYVGTEDFQGIKVNSAFGTLETSDGVMIIEANDLLNKTHLPLSEYELDIFLFGVFSFAVIVIIFISTILSGQISFPIKKLTNATRAVSNGDLSVEVEVTTKGELGELSNGFNIMVQKIKQNQIEIAQFEREEAWREMAKQVAHEINNPLTPMKLSVQQLAAAYKDNSQKFDQIFEKVTSTIISQIEILKNIASEFTNYARMPRASLVKVNVIVLVSEIINLYAEQNKYVEGIYHAKEINIVADSDHFKRTLVNLIRNSLQANSDKVLIDVAMESEFCVIRVIDNGMGITQDILPEIYNDKFTTKVSGMGLGLSMAKKYIESINGKIEVEKTNTSGTTFVITIPIA